MGNNDARQQLSRKTYLKSGSAAWIRANFHFFPLAPTATLNLKKCAICNVQFAFFCFFWGGRLEFLWCVSSKSGRFWPQIVQLSRKISRQQKHSEFVCRRWFHRLWLAQSHFKAFICIAPSLLDPHREKVTSRLLNKKKINNPKPNRTMHFL